MSLKLSKELEPFRETIENSKTNFIQISAEEKKKLSLTQSKFGGYPFLPKGMKYPESIVYYSEEETIYAPMILLAQINFKELPENDLFPKKGILQIYIGDDDSYGKKLSNSMDTYCTDLILQEGFKVFYFEDENVEYEQNFNFLEDIERECSPLGFENEQYGLLFNTKEEYVPATDAVRFKDFLEKEPVDFFGVFGEKRDSLWTAYANEVKANGHKMGGYGFVLQEDPRKLCKEYKDHILLLQLDSEGEICWGDSGSAQFFISKDDLKNRDFSKVVYYWACF